MMKAKEQNYKRIILTYFAIWLAFALAGVVIGVIATDSLKYYRLKTEGIKVHGQVIGKEPQNHQSIRYSYVVGEQTYSNLGSAGRGNPSFAALNMGDSVIVYYDPDNPSNSCLGYPSRHLQDSIGGIIFLVVLLPLFGIVGLYRKGFLKTRYAV
jgi:hypothetical protein